ncbi:MAG: hypothetical protein IJ704_03485, partial [Bacilli bacterium]|nr:hypothetical protein [Bacilli bacterium]
KAITYSTNYIAGFYADSLDMGKDTYVSPAQSIVEKDASSKMFKNKQIRKYGCTNPTVPLQLKESKVGMFPVYFLSMLDKTGKNISYAVINGQTGKVVADLPIDFKKYILGSLILTVPFFFLLNSFFVFTPTVVLIFGIILGAISLFISLSQLKELELRENGIEKQEPNQKENSIIETIIPYVFLLTSIFGLILGITMKTIVGFILFLSFFGASVYSKNAFIKSPKNNQKTTDQKKKTEKNKPMIKYIFKPILGIIMGIGVLVINFVNDIYYYGAALGILALIIWSFYDLVVEHNLLTKNKLPQLEKRGGRENE